MIGASRGALLLLAILGWAGWCVAVAAPAGMDYVDAEIAAHPGRTGAYILDTGEEALLARAWLADHARGSIEVQYFIWSSDNVGILATEALLRAADRGVAVRVLVDDLLIDAPDKTLLALAAHPGVDIRIYNPKHKVGTPLHKRLLNVATDFRGVNQRMHDKTFIVDGQVGITGGRNMADEYFDYDRDYTFRDRDVLLVGDAAQAMRANFEAFWASPLAVPVEKRFDGLGLMKKNVSVNDAEVQKVYRELHDYAARPGNFAPEVRAAIQATPESFRRIAREIVWTQVEFIHDVPGKNGNRWHLGGGGRSGEALAKLISDARESIVIQSPYLVMSNRAKALFEAAVARGVKVSILTNSLASTDNLQAFSGYRNQRRELLKMGLDIREYKPDPANRGNLMSRANPPEVPPVFALHAKSMTVDDRVAYIGTFNFDPRSENLNTEVGAIVRDAGFARRLRAIMEADMRPENSWRAADEPDRYVPLTKRGQVRLWQLLPLKPLL
ncbi:phospholipase D family protein [Betaproteobacteria bacterium SCN1]|jgi:putative cardiolipin synthase|nr:phospholipase D family protein [Betaproteobacteria bacterium SCN1]MBN8760531.1 phospholipase D family protein [Thiobacillus sp.]ODU88129.1 MAG: cardiolipin synthase [Thiobacillus sp. SCN 65-179]OJW36377.1 MAG: phospholipase D family protein [Thiobacillus sp. 65-69]